MTICRVAATRPDLLRVHTRAYCPVAAARPGPRVCGPAAGPSLSPDHESPCPNVSVVTPGTWQFRAIPKFFPRPVGENAILSCLMWWGVVGGSKNKDKSFPGARLAVSAPCKSSSLNFACSPCTVIRPRSSKSSFQGLEWSAAKV